MATEAELFSMPWPDTTVPGPQVGDGRKYTDAEWRAVWRTAFLSAKPDDGGVFNVPDDAEIERLEVTSAGANQIAVATGAACVDGLFVPNDAPVDLIPASAGAGATRKDRVVLRAVWGAGATQCTTVVAIKQGTQAAPPALTQTHNSTWEISLATYTIDDVGAISALTDERVYATIVARHEFETHLAAFTAHQVAATLDHPSNSVTNAKLRDSAGVSVIGRSANSSGDPADIAAAADDTLLGRVASVLGFVKLTLAMIPDALLTGAKIAINTIDFANIGQMLATSIAARPANSQGNLQILQAAANDTLLRRVSDALSFGQLTAGMFPAGVVGAGILANGAVDTTARMAVDIVDDTRVGNRVPQFYRRQGGSATDWSVVGTTTYTPGAVRIQAGVIETLSPAGGVNVTFPVAFSQPPIVVATCSGKPGTSAPMIVFARAVTTTKCSIETYSLDGLGFGPQTVNWIAIGSE